MFILLGLHIRCTPLVARLAIISGSSSGVRHKADGFPDQSAVRAARKLELGMSLLANPPCAHRRAQSRSDWEREKSVTTSNTLRANYHLQPREIAIVCVCLRMQCYFITQAVDILYGTLHARW